jgi:hypothetical protein
VIPVQNWLVEVVSESQTVTWLGRCRFGTCRHMIFEITIHSFYSFFLNCRHYVAIDRKARKIVVAVRQVQWGCCAGVL